MVHALPKYLSMAGVCDTREYRWGSGAPRKYFGREVVACGPVLGSKAAR